MNKLNEQQKSYIAGFLDADGCVGIDKTKSKSNAYKYDYRIRLIITNCDYSVIEWFREITGIGCSHKTGIQQKANWRKCHRWQVTGNQARLLLKEIYKYLIVKKTRAEKCLQIPHQGHLGIKRTEADYEKQEFLYKQLKEMNKRGI